MRLLFVLVLALALPGCDRAEPTAAPTSALPVRGPVEGGVATVAAAPASSCGGACGASCAGQGSCNGSCGGAIAEAAPAPAVPADAVWTELAVAGIRCGGCARRIKGALAHQLGVLGVEVDVATARVRIATVAGVDGRGLAQPVLDGLGYRVQ